jgi:hypothetical protein
MVLTIVLIAKSAYFMRARGIFFDAQADRHLRGGDQGGAVSHKIRV